MPTRWRGSLRAWANPNGLDLEFWRCYGFERKGEALVKCVDVAAFGLPVRGQGFVKLVDRLVDFGATAEQAVTPNGQSGTGS